MEHVIPLLAEQLEVGKRTIETGRVYIDKSVSEREELVAMPALERLDVDIERVAVNRVVDRPVATRTEGDVTIVPVHEEVLVVTRQLVLREELRIRLRSTMQAQPPQRMTLRREEIQIRRTPAPHLDTVREDDDNDNRPAGTGQPK